MGRPLCNFGGAIALDPISLSLARLKFRFDDKNIVITSLDAELAWANYINSEFGVSLECAR
jgi:hypothetical protein